MPERSYQGPFLALSDDERQSKDYLEITVRKLASQIGERNARNYQGLVAAENYLTESFAALGFSVRKQCFNFDGVEMNNIEAELRGSELADEIVVIGAHYDTVYQSPGADDNATGIGALIEIGRLLAGSTPKRTLRLIAFANEENQAGATWHTMGSYVYASECKSRNQNIVAMASLEMLGFYSDQPGSQHYPTPLNLLYPDVGNFIAFVGDEASAGLIRRCIGSFRRQCQFPSEGAAAPAKFRDINRSDHWSFWQFGYRAFMLTDTGNFRNIHYHTSQDTPDIVDFRRLARLTRGMALVVRDLLN